MSEKKLILLIISISIIFLLTPALLVILVKVHPDWLGLPKQTKTPKLEENIAKKDVVKIPIPINDFENLQKANLSKAILQVESQKLKEINKKLRDSLNQIVNKFEKRKDAGQSKTEKILDDINTTNLLRDSLLKLSSSLNEYKKSKEILVHQLNEIKRQNEKNTDSLKIKSLIEFAKIYNNSNPAEVAKILEKIDKKDAILILKSMQKKKAGKVIEAMNSEVNAEMIKALSVNSK